MSNAASWRLGRIAGAEILLRPSLLLTAVLVVVVFEWRFGSWAQANPYLLGAWLVVGLYLSVLVHELGHLAVARACGYRVETLTLHGFGGETAVLGDTRRPAHEFWIAASGPLVSALIAAAAWLLSGSLDRGDAWFLLVVLAWVNLLLAILNLLPALPLDGGRVVRGTLWAVTGDPHRATRLTAWLGRVLALTLVAVAVMLASMTAWFVWIDVAIVVLVGVFVWWAAGAALRDVERDQRIGHLVAADLSVPDDPGYDANARYPALSAELRGESLLRAMASFPADTYRLVDDDGRDRGFLRAADVDAAYRGGRP